MAILLVNSVEALQQRKFSLLTYEEKLRVKACGRDTPNLELSRAVTDGGVSFHAWFPACVLSLCLLS